MAAAVRSCMLPLGLIIVALCVALSSSVAASATSCPCPHQTPKCGENAHLFDKCFEALRKGERVITLIKGIGFLGDVKKDCCTLSKDCLCEELIKIKDADLLTPNVDCLHGLDCKGWRERAARECPCQKSCFYNPSFGPCTEEFRKGGTHFDETNYAYGVLPVPKKHDCCKEVEDRCKCLAKDIIVKALGQREPDVPCVKQVTCE